MRGGLFCHPNRFGRVLLAGFLLPGLGACTLEPIRTEPPAIEIQGKPAVLSYCYGSQVNQPSQVLEYAREDCPGGKLVFRGEDMLWTKCPLVQPVRATFLCYPADPESPEAKQSFAR